MTQPQIDTKLVHDGEPRPRILGAVSMPIFQTAMYESAGEESYDAIRYIRLNNTPNHTVLHDKLASIEGGEAALVTASGMAAISSALLTFLKQGDHLLVQNCLYGGTHELATEVFPALGISHDFVDGADPASWKSKLRPTTRVIYVETISNPLMEVPDLAGVVAFAREHGLVSMIDNTFATPVNFRPLEAGFDLSLHSGTKYLNGHSDLVAGAMIGSRDLVGRVRHRLNLLGGTLDPHACFLLHRGLKTLALRVRRQSASALSLARFLEGHQAVSRVNYPGLESHRYHGRAREMLDGFGGMLSFELDGDLRAAGRFIDRMKLPMHAPSLGGVETLVTRPAATSHAGLSPEDRARAGVTDGLLRVSVGIEGSADIVADFKQALA